VSASFIYRVSDSGNAGPNDILFIHRTRGATATKGWKYIQRMEAGEDIFADIEEEEDEDAEDNITCNRGYWSEEEKRCLLLGIKKHGKGNWTAITKLVKTR